MNPLKDCSNCESTNTVLAPSESEANVVCEDCGAETEGVNGWKMAR